MIQVERRLLGLGLASALVVLSSGCFGSRGGIRNIPPSRMPDVPKLAAASEKAATRVQVVSQKFLQANPGLGFTPIFLTIGVSEKALFHLADGRIYITEAMVQQCKDDSQLMALLSLEVARMAIENEELRPYSERVPPVQVPLSRDVANSSRSADQTDVAELAKFEKRNPRLTRSRRGELEPNVLARTYLAKTTVHPDTIEKVEGIYRAAQGQSQVEKQLTGADPALRGAQ
ncbi:hypothetical protein [Tuwongella immobilis]|uniref:Uncharacterized protein n=1 Tax=Tuwongella immobilis TaxID=692036 RepID=A0A6C2YVN8_9BACT|nr:hypothetical protein [Tuwongella immobilis]VIP05049.1 unnamed protein product [Tuwongella immobilis]VTS07454.1 unnamed protein product [Tuwongella immobilis]